MLVYCRSLTFRTYRDNEHSDLLTKAVAVWDEYFYFISFCRIASYFIHKELWFFFFIQSQCRANPRFTVHL